MTTLAPHSDRERYAKKVLADMNGRLSDHVLLHVDCSHNHHVAVVYQSAEGLIYASTPTQSGRTGRGQTATVRRSKADHLWVDFLDPGSGPTVDDALAAWCSCGPRSLSRSAVKTWVRDGERRVVVT